MDHITGDLDKLTMNENYGGSDQVHVADGSGMMIKHIGHSIVSTPSRHFYLNNVLHVPQATYNLAYIHCLTSDNLAYRCFLSFILLFFLSRTGARGTCFCMVNVGVGSIPFLWQYPPHARCVYLPPSPPHLFGMAGWVTPHSR
jgi:hypothetical protein